MKTEIQGLVYSLSEIDTIRASELDMHLLMQIVALEVFLGGLVALGVCLQLAWLWFNGHDFRTPEERAWETRSAEASPSGLMSAHD